MLLLLLLLLLLQTSARLEAAVSHPPVEHRLVDLRGHCVGVFNEGNISLV